MTQSTANQLRTQGFTNLSTNPQEQAAEVMFAQNIESVMVNAGIPLLNQAHIIGQVQQDLLRQASQEG